jgi:hypothetical protein
MATITVGGKGCLNPIVIFDNSFFQDYKVKIFSSLFRAPKRVRPLVALV